MVGSQEISLFNGPASVAYFREPSQQLTAKLANDYVEIVENRSCSLGVAGCRLSSPYPSLQMSNLRYESSVNLYWEEAGQKEYIYIADTQNHCIKRLSLLTVRSRLWLESAEAQDSKTVLSATTDSTLPPIWGSLGKGCSTSSTQGTNT